MICIVCKEDKQEDDFNWRSKPKGIRKNYCRTCDREIKKRYYERNKEKVISENLARTKKFKESFSSWKSTLQCCMCGETEEACLDFHHVNSEEKDYAISTLLTRGSLKKIQEELQKCICVCSNCHRKIHKYNIDVSDKAGVVFNG